MKKNIVIRVLAVLLLACMIVPQLVACQKQIAEETQGTEGVGTEPLGSQGGEEDIEIPSKVALKTMLGFSRKGNVLSMNIASEDSTLSLAHRFSVGAGAYYVMSNDEEGNDTFTNEDLTLKEGENVFYIKTVFGKENFTYKVVINYVYALTLEFYTNCDDYVETQAVILGDKAVCPTDPTKEGYTFLGWYLDGKPFDFNTAPVKSGTVIAHWDKNDKSMESYYTSCKEGVGAVEFTGISAGLRVVWKDYADASKLRPAEVTCILTQKYGSTTKTYDIVVSKDFAGWADSNNTPGGSTYIGQGDGGDWTLSLKNLPEKVGSQNCEYTLVQKALTGDYTTKQAGGAAYNTIRGYVASIDDTAKLTTRNARLYDAAGNLVVFNGVVTGNVGWARLLWDTEPRCLDQLTNIGCNAIRVTVPIIAAQGGEASCAWVYWAKNGLYRTARTGAYAKGQPTVDDSVRAKVIEGISTMIDRATEQGLYIIVNWPILTSNPYEYIDEAKDFFGQLSKKYADNPYVLYEICNEPGSCGWSTGNADNKTEGKKGIKAYAEEIIDVIRGNGSDGIIIVAPRASANYVSMSPASSHASNKGDDPIYDPLDDDRSYNVAYTHHAYPYMNAYSDETGGKDSVGWRLRDAHDAGLTMIITEMSPMDAKLDRAYPIGYDFESTNKYVRMFQEYDINYFYFKYLTVSKDSKDPDNDYDEWFFFKPGVDPRKKTWTRADITECGRWYYDIVTGDAMFVNANYTALNKEQIRNKYTDTFAAYGLKGDENTFTVYPGFAYEGIKLSDGTHYFKVDGADTLDAMIYERYCQFIYAKILKIDSSAKQMNGQAFGWTNVPSAKTQAMQLTYKYSGKTVTVDISYGQHTDGTWGVFVNIK